MAAIDRLDSSLDGPFRGLGEASERPPPVVDGDDRRFQTHDEVTRQGGQAWPV